MGGEKKRSSITAPNFAAQLGRHLCTMALGVLLSVLSASSSSPSPPGVFTCSASLLPTFCNTKATPEARVAELVSKMTLAEKIAEVGSNGSPGVPRLGIPAYQWWGEALHGVCSSPSVTWKPPIANGTSFPEPILTAASFDTELFSTIGKVIGTEGRSMANAGQSGLTYWAPK